MRNFLRYIPGFRSGINYKKVIAIIYYLLVLLMLIASPAAGIFLLAAPFLVFSFIDLIRHKKKAIPLQKALIPLIISFALIITSLSVMPKTEPADRSSPAPSETDQVDDSGGESEPVVENRTDDANNKETPRPDTSDKVENPKEAPTENPTEKPPEKPTPTPEPTKKTDKATGNLKVHFIDVGQGDCVLIHAGNNALLIDAGNSKDGPNIVAYIQNQGISKLDYLVLTHPHADHIGGAADVVNAFDIDKILMPKATHTSKTFEDLLLTIQSKGHRITSPSPGQDFSLGKATFKILASNDGSDLNNKSIVTRLVYGGTSFLFTGDAETATEDIILQRGYDIKSDVMKVGHHGSDTSTGDSFLKKVSPKHAIISVGKGNSYGHPSDDILAKLDSLGASVYRTDEVGTIVVTSDGNSLSFNKAASKIVAPKPTPKPTPEPTEEIKPTPKPTDKPTDPPTIEQKVYVGSTQSNKYHKPTCRHAKNIKPENEIWFDSAKEAFLNGYEPCGVCKPPR